jgi:TolB-like protein
MSLLTRLKERKLVQWALAYLAGAWVVLQVMDVLAEPLGLSAPFQLGVVVVVTAGFFVTLVLAWYHGEKGRQRVSGPELMMITVLLVIAGGVLSFVGWPDSTEQASEEAVPPLPGMTDDPRPSVAALPFDNLSPDPDDAYMAAGVHEAVLTHLARIAALKVISRTSVLEYRDQTKNIREIAEELGVANILEGSVQRAGDRLRITVQLIDARTDEHLWAESYDRDLSDIFVIQSDVATRVAEQLRVTLAPEVQARIESPPTRNPEAYAFYLRALEFCRACDQRGSLLSEAVQLDPDFAAGHAALALYHMWVYWWRSDRTDDRIRTAKASLDRSIALDPDLPEGHYAAGYYHYWGFADYPRAMSEFGLAAEGLPNDPRILTALGHVLRRSGRWEEAEDSYRKAVELDPRQLTGLLDLGRTLGYLRRFDEAEEVWAKLAAVNGFPHHESIRYLALQRGDGVRAEEMLHAHIASVSRDHQDWHWDAWAALLRRDYQRAAEAVEGADQDVWEPQALYVRPLHLAEIYRLLDQPELALTHYDSARTRLEALTLEYPRDARIFGLLGIAYAGLGRGHDAVVSALRATTLASPEHDALFGPWRLIDLATVYVIVGDFEAALELLEWLLEHPSAMTVGRLRAEPRWDPLRDHPRFQALLEKYGSEP